MRLVIAALLFAALAIAAAELGWFQPELPGVAVSSANAPPAARPPSRPALRPQELPAVPPGDDGEALDEVTDEVEDTRPAQLTVHVERGYDEMAEIDRAHSEIIDELDPEARPAAEPDAEPELPPLPVFRVRAECGDAKAEAVTDEEGVARFPALPQGECTVVAAAPGWAVATSVAYVGEDEEVTLGVFREAVLALRVVDGRGQPVPGAHFSLFSETGEPLAPVLRATVPGAIVPPPPPPPPDPDASEDELVEMGPFEQDGFGAVTLAVAASGRLELPGLRPGGYVVSVTHDGFASASRTLYLSAGQRAEASFTVERSASLEVLVDGVADPETIDVVVSAGDGEGFVAEGLDEVESTPGAGPWRFEKLPPGDVTVEVLVNGTRAHVRRVALAPAERKALSLRVALAAIEVLVDGAVTPAPAPRAPSRKGILVEALGARPQVVMLLCGAGATQLSQSAAVVQGRARFEVPAGEACAVWLQHPMLGPRADVTAPATVRLTATKNEVVFAARNPRASIRLTLAPVGAPERTLVVGGVGEARAADVAPGRYQLTGWAGADAVVTQVDVTTAASQRIALEPSAPSCFSARVLDATTGEAVEFATLTPYERAGRRLREVSVGSAAVLPATTASAEEDVTNMCFAAKDVARVAVAAEGYETVSVPAAGGRLGTVRLRAVAEGSFALADALLDGDDGFTLLNDGYGASGMGLRSGDTLVAVDGQPVEDLVLHEVQSRLVGAPGTPVKLRVRGADGVRDVVIARP